MVGGVAGGVEVTEGAEGEGGAGGAVADVAASAASAVSPVSPVSAASVVAPPWWAAVASGRPAPKTRRMLSMSRVLPTLAATARMASPSYASGTSVKSDGSTRAR